MYPLTYFHHWYSFIHPNELEHRGENENAQASERPAAKAIRTWAPSTDSLAFYCTNHSINIGVFHLEAQIVETVLMTVDHSHHLISPMLFSITATHK